MIERAARAAVHALLGRVRSGSIELREDWSQERHRFGPDDAPLRAAAAVRTPAAYRMLVRERSVGLGRAYADGLWDADDLVSLLRIGARELRRSDRARSRLAPLLRPLQRLAALPVLNTRRGARRNVAAHYDLGNEMFELFLDREWMMYSSALFERPKATLEEAQGARLERICDALELGPDRHLLEIGTGWGGLALYAASRRGCRVTTTTISRQQREYAEARIRAAGLESRVRVLGADYRELTGRYDRLASIEMIEAVGWEYFDAFFARCSALLEPHGLMFLQAIAIDDRAYEAEKSSRSFSNTLIFPGGCLPSLGAIQGSITRRTDLRPVWLEDIGQSYALTLRHWRRRFKAASDRLAGLGYDERFRRLWEIYLAISEAGFREARLRDLQVLYAKPGWPHGSSPALPAATPPRAAVRPGSPSLGVAAGRARARARGARSR
jgi:cyclopropane-fatty-acyl-phospholipid synthase